LVIKHIIPEGFDHILYVASLCLLSTKIKTILWQATAFTVAHSITLALSMKGIIVAPGTGVERNALTSPALQSGVLKIRSIKRGFSY